MNDIKKSIEVLKEQIIKNEKILDGLPEKARARATDLSNVVKACHVAIKALTKQLIDENCNPFKWQKCKRKNGSEFLKLIYYSQTVDGYVEVGRFNMSKQELVQNEWSLNEIYEVLKNE